MKKIYLTMFTAASIIGLAQNSNKAALMSNLNSHELGGANPKVIHPPVNPNATGDTVWLFDGYNSYDINGTLPSTYSINVEDLDGLTITSGLQPYFGTTGDYKFFYTIDSANLDNIEYGHPDSLFYAAATSWFSPAGQSDNWLEFGPIHVPATGGTLIWRHNEPDKTYRDGYQVLVNTNSINSFDFTDPAIFSVGDNDPSTLGDTVNTPNARWYQRSADMNAYAGQDVYIAFRHYAMDMFIIELTDIMLIEGTIILDANSSKDNSFTVGQNMPNPANGSTSINYSLKSNTDVLFNVTDLTGKVIYTENFSNQSAGSHRVDFNTANISNGMYLYNFVINGQKVTHKFVVEN